MKRSQVVTLPTEVPASFLPFIAASGAFKVSQENGRIILEPKTGPLPAHNGNGKTARTTQAKALAAPVENKAALDRARMFYRPADKRLTPEKAKAYGMSATRLKVYRTVYMHANKGQVLARDVMTKTKLPHGSVQQTLNWLRSQRLVKGESLL